MARPDIETRRSPPTLAELRAQRDTILAIARKHGASNIRVVGSVARGDARPDSDLDLMIDMAEGRSLWDMAGLNMDLQDLLGCEIGLMTEAGLRERVRLEVQREAVAL